MKKLTHRKNSISDRVESINYAAVKNAFSAGRKEGVINLTIGQPDFAVPLVVRKDTNRYIKDGFNRYTDTRGILKLRVAISKYLQKKKIKRDKDEIIVTPGTTAGIYMSLMAIINPGDEVIIFEPYFVAYMEIINLLGGKAVIAKTDTNFQPSITDLRKAVSKKTKAVILNSPNNPTGAVYTKEVIQEIISVVKRVNAYIISDEIYREFSYGVNVFSPAEFYKKTIVLDGLSKSKAMTGWRIGFVAGPKNIIDAIEKIQQFTFVCAPAPFQYASADHMNEEIDESIINRYRIIRDTLCNELGSSYKIIKPHGAFYIFIETPVSGELFAKKLLENNIAVVPGSAFGINYKKFIRISFAIETKLLPEIIEVFKKIVKDA